MSILVSPTNKRPLLHLKPKPIDSLPRDKRQRKLLHEPQSSASNNDLLSVEYIRDELSHPSPVDGNLPPIYSWTKRARITTKRR